MSKKLKPTDPMYRQSLQAELLALTEKKAELEAIKALAESGTGEFSKESAEELTRVMSEIDAVKLALDELGKSEMARMKSGYKVPAGTEKCVHLVIDRAAGVNGKSKTVPHVQVFNYGEWRVFKENCHALGYKITTVLHDPYNEAQKLKDKQDEKPEND